MTSAGGLEEAVNGKALYVCFYHLVVVFFFLPSHNFLKLVSSFISVCTKKNIIGLAISWTYFFLIFIVL